MCTHVILFMCVCQSFPKTHIKMFFLVVGPLKKFFSSKEKIDETKYEPLRFQGEGEPRQELSGPTTKKNHFFYVCLL